MPLDDDGFELFDQRRTPPVKAPPEQIEMPQFFAGCRNSHEARLRMAKKLLEPMSVQIHGHDEAYRRIANALVLILANLEDFEP